MNDKPSVTGAVALSPARGSFLKPTPDGSAPPDAQSRLSRTQLPPAMIAALGSGADARTEARPSGQKPVAADGRTSPDATVTRGNAAPPPLNRSAVSPIAQNRAPAVAAQAPAVKPGAPAGKPGAPAVKPGAPGAKPGAPGAKPGVPAVRPGAPGAKPPIPAMPNAIAVAKGPQRPQVQSGNPGLPQRGLSTDLRVASAKQMIEFDPRVLEADSEEQFRRSRNFFLFRLFLFIVVPTLLAAFYSYIYATPRYVSEFEIVYKDTSSSGGGGLSALLGGGGVDMNRLISDYMTSPQMLDIVDKKLDIRKDYSDASVDWLDRMPADAPREKFLKYFQKRVYVYEDTGGFLIADVEAYSPERALAIATVIHDAADAMVSEIGDRPHRDMVDFTLKEMNRFKVALDRSTTAITNFREEHSDYNYLETVGQLSTVVGALQSQLAQTRADLVRARSTMSDTAPTVAFLKTKVASLEEQIATERTRFGISGEGETPASRTARAPERSVSVRSDGDSYSKIAARYGEVVLAQELAKADYSAAAQAYEAAQLQLAKKTAYVVTFVDPSLPQRADKPDGKFIVLTVFVVAFLGYFILALIGSILMEQLALE